MPQKFSVSALMNTHSKNESGGDDAFAFKIEILDFEQIEPSKLNFFTVDDVEELQASIELVGLQQNLVVRKRAENSKYELLSGERRYTAISRLVAEGKEQFRRIPCKIVKSIDDVQAELQLILANSTARRLSDYELSHQARRLKELLTELKDGGYKFAGKKRDIIAELLGVSASQIARYESINKNLAPELSVEFQKGNINVTTAYEASRLDSKQQAQVLDEHKNGVPVTPDSVKERRKRESPQKEAAKDYDPGCCDSCRYCKIQHVQKYQETYWKCKLMKYKECFDSTILDFTIFEHMPSWCPLKKQQPAASPPNPIASEAGQVTHEVKIHPDMLRAVAEGLKTFEYRRNDRNYQVGDVLRLRQFVPEREEATEEFIDVKVTYILRGDYGLPPDFVVMSIVKV
ncbi:MAG: DUF3850 domain-containing protein [Defluviitaleaceae bacterium]|nr:DUF3850 domain-containing protein [Defluviitaleaceae bacterium]